ncbi:hypothetical protein [Pediococcus acidilactici]|nr:hypothetical protein [Pediococcus acidilactici]
MPAIIWNRQPNAEAEASVFLTAGTFLGRVFSLHPQHLNLIVH